MNKTCIGCKYYSAEVPDRVNNGNQVGCILPNHWVVEHHDIETKIVEINEKLLLAKTCEQFEDIRLNLDRTTFR